MSAISPLDTPQGRGGPMEQQRACERCGAPFTPRSGSGGSFQRFCCTDCRLSFHKERLRSQRMGLYAGQLPEPATQAYTE